MRKPVVFAILMTFSAVACQRHYPMRQHPTRPLDALKASGKSTTPVPTLPKRDGSTADPQAREAKTEMTKADLEHLSAPYVEHFTVDANVQPEDPTKAFDERTAHVNQDKCATQEAKTVEENYFERKAPYSCETGSENVPPAAQGGHYEADGQSMQATREVKSFKSTVYCTRQGSGKDLVKSFPGAQVTEV